jgi:hypothetical protein
LTSCAILDFSGIENYHSDTYTSISVFSHLVPPPIHNTIIASRLTPFPPHRAFACFPNASVRFVRFLSFPSFINLLVLPQSQQESRLILRLCLCEAHSIRVLLVERWRDLGLGLLATALAANSLLFLVAKAKQKESRATSPSDVPWLIVLLHIPVLIRVLFRILSVVISRLTVCVVSCVEIQCDLVPGASSPFTSSSRTLLAPSL